MDSLAETVLAEVRIDLFTIHRKGLKKLTLPATDTYPTIQETSPHHIYSLPLYFSLPKTREKS